MCSVQVVATKLGQNLMQLGIDQLRMGPRHACINQSLHPARSVQAVAMCNYMDAWMSCLRVVASKCT